MENKDEIIVISDDSCEVSSDEGDSPRDSRLLIVRGRRNGPSDEDEDVPPAKKPKCDNAETNRSPVSDDPRPSTQGSSVAVFQSPLLPNTYGAVQTQLSLEVDNIVTSPKVSLLLPEVVSSENLTSSSAETNKAQEVSKMKNTLANWLPQRKYFIKLPGNKSASPITARLKILSADTMPTTTIYKHPKKDIARSYRILFASPAESDSEAETETTPDNSVDSRNLKTEPSDTKSTSDNSKTNPVNYNPAHDSCNAKEKSVNIEEVSDDPTQEQKSGDSKLPPSSEKQEQDSSVDSRNLKTEPSDTKSTSDNSKTNPVNYNPAHDTCTAKEKSVNIEEVSDDPTQEQKSGDSKSPRSNSEEQSDTLMRDSDNSKSHKDNHKHKQIPIKSEEGLGASTSSDKVKMVDSELQAHETKQSAGTSKTSPKGIQGEDVPEKQLMNIIYDVESDTSSYSSYDEGQEADDEAMSQNSRPNSDHFESASFNESQNETDDEEISRNLRRKLKNHLQYSSIEENESEPSESTEREQDESDVQSDNLRQNSNSTEREQNESDVQPDNLRQNADDGDDEAYISNVDQEETNDEEMIHNPRPNSNNYEPVSHNSNQELTTGIEEMTNNPSPDSSDVKSVSRNVERKPAAIEETSDSLMPDSSNIKSMSPEANKEPAVVEEVSDNPMLNSANTASTQSIGRQKPEDSIQIEKND